MTQSSLEASVTEAKVLRPNSAGININLFVQISRYTDGILVGACYLAAWYQYASYPLATTIIGMLAVPLTMELLLFFGFYESHRLHDFRHVGRQLLSSQVVAALFLALPLLLFTSPPGDSIMRLVVFSALGTAGLFSRKISTTWGLKLLRRLGLDRRNVCFIGCLADAAMIAARLRQHPEWGVELRVVGEGPAGSRRFLSPDGCTLLGDRIEDVIPREAVDEVWIFVPPEELDSERHTLALCPQYGLVGRVLMPSHLSAADAADLEELCESLPTVAGAEPQKALELWLKRSMDIVLASLLLILTVPLLLAAAVLVKLSSPGPILFSQMRVGLRGRHFRIYKFRTMIYDAEEFLAGMQFRNITGGPAFKDPHDWRVTHIGRILRRFSIDELPQLWNVIRGDMSIVGPRPLPVGEANQVGGAYARRFSMKPGLTCFWQVSGRSNIAFSQWMKLDVQYIENWSLWLDARLIAKTVPAVLRGRGAC